jgi:hypothetical protein
MNIHNATTVVVANAATTQRQHSATTTAMMPPGAGPKATLEAARQLHHNPLGLNTSPSAAEQWRHDVDQLVITAINTPPCEGWWANHSGGMPVPSTTHSCNATVPRALSVARAPMVPRVPAVSLATTDLREPSPSRCGGPLA